MTKRKAREDPDSSDEEAVKRDSRSLSKRKTTQTKGKGVSGKDRDITADGPFGNNNRPSEAEARAARDSLAQLHGEPTRPDFVSDSTGKNKKTILDSLVQTILSQNTTDSNSHKTFANLKADFKDWEEVRHAPAAKIEASIKLGGLAAIKSQRIKTILNSTVESTGACSLEHLRELPDEDIKVELLKFNGVGPKTAACVLMFAMGRFEFPVDTHVWRITKSLGWVPKTANREDTYEHLNTRIPDDIKYDLHVLLVEHGKRCVRCAKNGHPRKEQHGPCPLTNLAAAARAGHKLSGKKAAQDAEKSLQDLGADADVKEEDAPDSAAKTEEDNEDIVKKEEENGSHAVKEEVDEAVKEDPQIKEDPQMKEEAGTLVKGELGSQKPASKKNRNRKKV